MRDRVAAGTFHAIAYAQLRRWWADRGEPPPALLDRKARLLARLVAGPARASTAPGRPSWPPRSSGPRPGWSRPTGYEDAAAAAGRRPPAPGDAIGRPLRPLRGREAAAAAWSTSTICWPRCAAAIETDPGFAAAQRWRWRHLFVDEFQDVNPLQYRLLLAWLGRRPDLCVVGDPNQAIYGWNGADPGLLTGLAERWPGTEVVRLDANHRCTPQVVAAAAGALGLAPGERALDPARTGRRSRCAAYATDRAEAAGRGGRAAPGPGRRAGAGPTSPS